MAGCCEDPLHSTVLFYLSLSCVQFFATPCSVAYLAPPSMGLSRQEFWSGLPFLSPGDLPDPGIEPRSPALQADALPSEPSGRHKILTTTGRKKMIIILILRL